MKNATTLLVVAITSLLTACSMMPGGGPSAEEKKNMAFIKWNPNPMVPGHRGAYVNTINGEKVSMFSFSTWLEPGTYEIAAECGHEYSPTSSSHDGKTFGSTTKVVTFEAGKEYFLQTQYQTFNLDIGEWLNGKFYPYKEVRCVLVSMPLDYAKKLSNNIFFK